MKRIDSRAVEYNRDYLLAKYIEKKDSTERMPVFCYGIMADK